MPRIANNTDALLKNLIERLERLVQTAKTEGREDALASVRSLVDGKAKTRATPGRASRGKKMKPARRKSTKPRKNWWDTATDAQKKARVKKMLAGRGLKPKGDR